MTWRLTDVSAELDGHHNFTIVNDDGHKIIVRKNDLLAWSVRLFDGDEKVFTADAKTFAGAIGLTKLLMEDYKLAEERTKEKSELQRMRFQDRIKRALGI